MKKIIFAALLLAGFGFTASAQQAASKLANPTSASSNSPKLFKEKSLSLEAAFKANDFAEAQKLTQDVQQLIMKRGDDFLGKNETKAKEFHDMGYQMKAMISNVAGNKDKILALTTKVQAMY